MAVPAKVVDPGPPIVVRLKGDTADTTAQRKADGLPAVVADDDVLVEIIDRLVIITTKVVAA